MPGDARHGHIRPIIRVFVSSTFSDLRHERDALQRTVFPQLELLCAGRGFHFHAIDLRWGVSTEAALHHRSMQICFAELARSQAISPRPNFLILLGNRYGWRPLPELLDAREFSALSTAADQLGEADLLQRWYPCDENAARLTYYLQSRLRDFGDHIDYSVDGHWVPVEAALWRILNQAFPPERLAHRFQLDAELARSIVCCQASATEQEIWRGALGVQDAAEHVVAWFRDIDNLPDMVTEHGISAFADLAKGGVAFDRIPQGALRDLKAEIGHRLGGETILTDTVSLRRTVEAGRTGLDVTTEHLDGVCARIYTRLTAIIRRQMDDYWQGAATFGSQARRLQIEIETHRRFGAQRADEQVFVGREAELERIRAYLDGPSREPLIITGASGSGKTALLARAVTQTVSEHAPIVRFIGISPQTSALRPLLETICSELRQASSTSEIQPSELNALVTELAARLTSGGPLQLFLDGLDLLADSADSGQLYWLPEGELAEGVKLVVSCLSGRDASDPAGQPFAALAQRNLKPTSFISLDALEHAQARSLLFDHWLAGCGRCLTAAQARIVDLLLVRAGCRQPLYLKLLFEEARLWRSYDTITAPGERVSDLLDMLFDRLCLPANHGVTAICMLGYLGASRRGLSENEILEVLFWDQGYRAFLRDTAIRTAHELPPDGRRVPIALCAGLWHDLAAYLVNRQAPGGSVLTFYHRVIGEYVRRRFTSSGPTVAWHRKLADWFAMQGNFLELTSYSRVANARKADELPWHWLQAGMLHALDTLYGEPGFIEAAISGGLVDGLVDDPGDALYQHVLPHVSAVRAAVLRSSAALRSRPNLALQTLRNDLAFALGAEAVTLAQAIQHELDQRGPWLAAETAPPRGADTSTVWALQHASLVQVLSATRETLLVATKEGSVQEYRLDSGQSLGTRQLSGGPAMWLAVSRGGRLAWRTRDAVVHVAGSSRTLLGRPGGDSGGFLGERCLLLATADQQLVLWDATNDSTVTLQDSLARRPMSVTTSPDGRHAVVLAALAEGGQFVAWLTETDAGFDVRRIEGLPALAMAGDVGAGGKSLALALLDRTIRLYGPDLRETQQIFYEIESENAVTGIAVECALPPSGAPECVLLATNSRQIGIWQVAAGRMSAISQYRSLEQPTALCVLGLLDDARRYVASTHDEVWIAATTPASRPRPPTAVTSCALSGAEWAAAASQTGQYIEWWRGVPYSAVAHSAVPHPTVLEFCATDGTLFAGNLEGQVWRQRPGEARQPKDVFLLFDQPVVSIFAAADGRAVAAAKSGAVMVVDFANDDAKPLVAGNPGIEQIEIIRCNARGDFLSWTRDKGAAGEEWIGIVGLGGQRDTIYRGAKGIGDVAVAPDGETVAIASHNGVAVYRRRNGSWLLTMHTKRHASRISFCGDHAMAAVLQSPDAWVEIWSLNDELCTIAAVHTPADCRALATDATRVLAGSASGGVFLWSLRMAGGP